MHPTAQATNVHSLLTRSSSDAVRPARRPAEANADIEPSNDLDAALEALMLRDIPELQAHVEHRLVHTAYALCGQNQVRTARLLGISRNVLRAQLIRFGYLRQTGARRATRPRDEVIAPPGVGEAAQVDTAPRATEAVAVSREA